jgi:hypothetical protein
LCRGLRLGVGFGIENGVGGLQLFLGVGFGAFLSLVLLNVF